MTLAAPRSIALVSQMCDKTIALDGSMVHSRGLGQFPFDTCGLYKARNPVSAGVQKKTLAPPHTQWHFTILIRYRFIPVWVYYVIS